MYQYYRDHYYPAIQAHLLVSDFSLSSLEVLASTITALRRPLDQHAFGHPYLSTLLPFERSQPSATFILLLASILCQAL